MNLMRVGSDFVLVGAPSYTWKVGGTRAVMASDRAHLASYLDEATPRLVEMPVDVPPGMVRSVVLDERRWGVLFSEADPEAFSALGVVAGLWYAEYDGERWSDAERVPVPDGAELFVGTASSLVRRGDAIAWVIVTSHDGAVFDYERRDGSWRLEVVDELRMEAAATASGPSGVWLALSGVDPDLPAWTKSVRLFRWAPGWRFVSRLATVETDTEIQDLFATALPDGVTVTWRELGDLRSVAMARVGIGTDGGGTPLVVDRGAERAVPLAMPDGAAAWVVQHINEITGLAELRLVRPQGRGTSVSWAIPYPYTGFYAATAAGPDEVLVTGSEFSPDPAQPTVRSLTLRLSTSCQ